METKFNEIVEISTTADISLEGIKCSYGDAASGGLLYLLCNTDNKPLMKACFCKDYFQDFAFGHSTNIIPEQSIYGFNIKDHYINETFIQDNPTLVFYLYEGSKGINGKTKKDLVNKILNDSENIKRLINQLDILESIFLDLNLITKKSIISVVTSCFNKELRKTIKVEFSSEYLHLPETLSLFTLLLRNFLTFEIFKKYDTRIEDLNNFLTKSKSIPVNQYIYSSDSMIFSSDNTILKLPLILEGKIKLHTNWDLFKSQNISQIHNYSGIFSFISKP